jgi:hypothetical protein
MSFELDLRRAAYRNFEAAEHLVGSARFDVAGYLYGIAAECAVKAMLGEVGIRPLSAGLKRDDPYFAHFPELKTQVRDNLSGRRSSPLTKFMNDSKFMAHWAIAMRYSPGHDIKPEWVQAWRDQARQVIASIGT